MGREDRGSPEFLCGLRMPCQPLSLPQRRLGPIWCACSPPCLPCPDLSFPICKVSPVSPNLAGSDGEVWGSSGSLCLDGTPPSRRRDPPARHWAKCFRALADGIVLLHGNLQWLPFAFQTKTKLLSQVYSPLHSSSLMLTLSLRPGLLVAPCTLSPWPSQVPLPVQLRLAASCRGSPL